MTGDAKGPLDQAERALQSVDGGTRQSEMSFLLRLLQELGHVVPAGVSPAGLLRAALHDGPLMRGAQDPLRVLATPSQRPGDALRPGDWMLRAIPGTGDVGHVSVLASSDLLSPSTLAAEGIATESAQPGYYGVVIEAGAFPHDRARPFARRWLDRCGRVPPHTVVLRPTYRDPGLMTDLPPNEPEPSGLRRAFDIEELEEFAGCPLAEDAEFDEQVAPQQVPTPATPQGPDSSLANRFIAAHPTRYCTPGQAGSDTCRTLVSPRPVRRVVVHTLAVPSTARRSGIEAVVAGWQNVGREASAHYLVDRDGTVTQMVREADVAFHTPGNNSDSIGIEHADVCNDPAPLTTQLYERSAALVRDLAARHGFAINNNTVAGHSQVNPNHGDPGPYWDWEYYFLLLAWAGMSAASRPLRLVSAVANLPAAPTGWQVQRRRTIANDRCASQRDPWGATYWRAPPSATAPAAEVSIVVDEACTYKLSLWWPNVAGANPAAPLDIEVGCLTSPCTGTSAQTVTVNQRPNAGRWNDVAVVNVTQTPAEVKVRWRRNSAERGWILVDGVRLLKIASCPGNSLKVGIEELEMAGNDSSVTEGDREYERTLDRIRQELTLRFTDANDPGLLERRRRLRDLFNSIAQNHTRRLHARLGERPTGDELSALFHGRLATATRRELLGNLESRFPADGQPTPTKPALTEVKSLCRREMGAMKPLLPWERSLLALVHDKSEADFKSVVILIGPIILPGLIAWPQDAIVKMALKDNYAITIGDNIWFPHAIDTSTVDDLAWLVHESVHVVDYAVAGTEAFLRTYVQQALVHGFRHDDIPLERRANRVEMAVKRMLARFPELVRAIGSCDGSAILAQLERQKDVYRAALNESMREEQ